MAYAAKYSSSDCCLGFVRSEYRWISRIREKPVVGKIIRLLSVTKHIILRSASELYLAFYGCNCFLYSKKAVSMCEREWMSPISCCQNPIILVTVIPLHFIHTPVMHCHLSLTPTLSRFLYPFEVACVWLPWATLHFETDCTMLSSTSHAETWVALCRPRAWWSAQTWFLTNVIVSLTGCRITGVEMQDVKLGWEWLRRCFRHIIEFVLFMPFKLWFLVGYNYASSLLSLRLHPLVEQNSYCKQRVFCIIKADAVILLILQICLVAKWNLYCR